MNTPEDSILRRHYEQMQQAGGSPRPSPAAVSTPPPQPAPSAPPAGAGAADSSAHSSANKGFLGRLMDKLTGRG